MKKITEAHFRQRLVEYAKKHGATWKTCLSMKSPNQVLELYDQEHPEARKKGRRPVRTDLPARTGDKLYRIARCKGRVVFSDENLHPSLDSEEVGFSAIF